MAVPEYCYFTPSLIMSAKLNRGYHTINQQLSISSTSGKNEKSRLLRAISG